MLPLLLACADDPEPPAPPDLVLVVVDTLRADHLGVYGHERPTSPEIDAIARGGVYFQRAYSHSGWTLPSFASLLTGLLPHEHRVGRDGADPNRIGRLRSELTTLPEQLGVAGYATAAVMNNPFLAPEWGLQQGFDRYDWAPSPGGAHRSAEQTVDAGLAWLQEQVKPGFLLLHVMEPHLPYAPLEADRGKFAPRDQSVVPVPFEPGSQVGKKLPEGERPPDAYVDMVARLYDEELLAVDRAVGRLARALAERVRPHGLVITADHGEELWDHGGFEHGHSLMGELVRVPLIVSGAVQARGEVQTVVQHADLFRGLLTLAGAPPPPGTRGADLFALAAAGPHSAQRVALSENCLYGPERTAIVSETTRVSVNLASGAAEAWSVAANGSEPSRLANPGQEGERLLSTLSKLRGGLSMFTVREGTRIASPEEFQELRESGRIKAGGVEAPPSPEVLEMLRELGYVRGDDTTGAETP